MTSVETLLHAPEDELLHPVPAADDGTMPWKDTWWFSFRDAHADMALGLHQTISQNRGDSARTAIALRHGLREVNATLTERRLAGTDRLGNTLADLEVIDGAWTDDKRLTWRITHPEVELELNVTGYYAGPDINALVKGFWPGMNGRPGLQHAEQNGKFTGWIRWVGEEPIELSGFLGRDRSWGWRKSDETVVTDWVYLAGVLPECAFVVCRMRLPGYPADGPTPIVGWRSGAEGISAAVDGRYWRMSTGRPNELSLSFADGARIDLRAHAHGMVNLYSFHDAEYDGNGIGVSIMDNHADWADADGRREGIGVIANHGTIFPANAFRDTVFLH